MQKISKDVLGKRCIRLTYFISNTKPVFWAGDNFGIRYQRHMKCKRYLKMYWAKDVFD